MNHLRSANYGNIITAEKEANALPSGIFKEDIDQDGIEEAVISSEEMSLFVDKDGNVFEWDLFEPPGWRRSSSPGLAGASAAGLAAVAYVSGRTAGYRALYPAHLFN